MKKSSPESVLKLVRSLVDESLPLAYLGPVVADRAFAQVFADKKNPKIDAINEFVPLLKRVVGNDSHAQMNVVFKAQGAWFAATNGLDKVFIGQLFSALLDQGVVSGEGFNAWREDRSDKTKGKPMALLKVNKWLEEVVAKLVKADDEEEQDGEGDEGDGEELDPYLQNPNLDS